MRIVPSCGQRSRAFSGADHQTALKRSNGLQESEPDGCTVPFKDGPRPAVDLISGEADFTLFYRAQVHSLREVLAEQWSGPRKLDTQFRILLQGVVRCT
jgi:hypothetical protein